VRVQAGRKPNPSAAIIASQSVKTTLVGGPRGDDGGKQVNGRKRHLLVDTQGLIMRAVVHPADMADRDGAKRLVAPLHGQLPRLRHIWADSAYSGKAREWIEATVAARWRSSSIGGQASAGCGWGRAKHHRRFPLAFISCRAGGWWNARLLGF
jgi:transposase